MAESHRIGDTVEVEVRIAAKPQTIFPYLTDLDKMLTWMGFDGELDPRPGGIYRLNVKAEAVARGEYVEVVPNERVVFTFGWEGDDQMVTPGSTTVEITLTPDGDETLVRLRHYGLEGDMQERHTEGWNFFMPRLVIACQGGTPESYQ
ncbi:MAG: SRPBCC domain-containing protein [Chloroflexi bacterium]|nr:SRPBCC domain-containing protein [Chloroflexota bacterium]